MGYRHYLTAVRNQKRAVGYRYWLTLGPAGGALDTRRPAVDDDSV